MLLQFLFVAHRDLEAEAADELAIDKATSFTGTAWCIIADEPDARVRSGASDSAAEHGAEEVKGTPTDSRRRHSFLSSSSS